MNHKQKIADIRWQDAPTTKFKILIVLKYKPEMS